jgi:hypothetical protein
MPIDDPRADEIKALCRDYAEQMVGVLVDIATDPSAKEAPRVKAAETVLLHGFGAPARKVEKTVDVTLHDHRSAQLNVFRKLADRRAKEQLLIPHDPDTPDQMQDVQDAEFEEIRSTPKSPVKEAKNR